MTRKVKTVQTSATVAEVRQLLAVSRFRRVPVMDANRWSASSTHTISLVGDRWRTAWLPTRSLHSQICQSKKRRDSWPTIKSAPFRLWRMTPW
ncbi:MAG: CBS domain-containing protein [Chloroflexi bacterium]|nr:CBS domain-containing protein [Chloroflexota bacterium]